MTNPAGPRGPAPLLQEVADDLGDERFVLIGRPDDTLTAGLHSVGLAPVAEDGEVVVWAPPPSPQPPGP